MVESTETLSMQDVMRLMGISSRYAYKLVHNPGFPSVFVGNKCVIPKTAFFLWWQNPESIIKFKAMLDSESNEYE